MKNEKIKEAPQRKGVLPKTKNKKSSVQKSRDNKNKTQDDYFRLFKSGTRDEARQAVQHLSQDNLITLFTNPTESVKDRVRENYLSLVTTYCNLDDGNGFDLVYTFNKSYYGSCLPMSYLYKVVNTGKFSKEKILKMSKRTDEKISPMPDSFYDAILKDLVISESLNMNYLFTDAILQRMSNAEIINVLKRMAGMKGVFLLVGLDVQDEDNKKMSVMLSEETMCRFDSSVYAEIKDFLLDVTNPYYCSEMVAANNDKAMAKEMLEAGMGRQKVLGKILNYEEKLAILKDQIEVSGVVQRYLTIREFFNDREQKEVFKELLKMNNEFALPYLKEHWSCVRYKSDPKVIEEYLAILETVPSKYAPIDSYKKMPKKTRIILISNGVAGDGGVLHDFTRKELEASGFNLNQIAEMLPAKLKEWELIELANSDSAFLKKNLELYPKDYIKHKFKDPEFRKEFIGDRKILSNRIANEELERKLAK